MPPALHELFTWITVGGAIAWLVVHFSRRGAACDGCEPPSSVRDPIRGVRPAALKVLRPGSGG